MNRKSPQESGYPASGRNLTKIIYNLKLGQAIIILIVLAILLYLLDYIGTLPNVPPFLVPFNRPPFPALADACLTSAVVGFAFERLVRSESRAELSDLLNHHLQEQRDAYLALLPKALLLNVPVQRELIKEHKLDEVIQTALQSKFGDRMGEEVYHGLLRNATAYKEFRRNYRHQIFVRQIKDQNVPRQVQQEFFDVVTEITYETTLQKSCFLFACVDTQKQFNQLLQCAEYEDIWVSPLQPPNQAVFKLLEISVDEVELKMVPRERDGRFEVVCEDPSLTRKMGQNVTVRYRFKTKAEQIGHVIHTTVNYPTYDVTIEFDFGNSSIDYVEVLDYFVSSRSPSIHPTPDEEHPDKISVTLKEWVFPKGGVAFVWSLKEEDYYLQQRRKQSQRSSSSEEDDEPAS